MPASWLRVLARLLPKADRRVITADMTELHVRRVARVGRVRGGLWLATHIVRVALALRWLDLRPNRLGADLRSAFRCLRREPGFAAAVVMTLALGIGAATGVFSLVNAVFFAPMGMSDPDGLIQIGERLGGRTVSASYPNALDLRARATMLSSVVAYQADTATLSYAGSPARLKTYRVSAGFFETLGATPALGRALAERDHEFAAAPVAVLSHRGWMTAFGGAPDVLGRTVRIDDAPYTIVGVMPRGLEFFREADAWLPLEPLARGSGLEERSSRSGTAVVARMAPGGTHREVRAELAVIAAQLAAEHPQANRELAFVDSAIRSAIAGPGARQLWMVLATVFALLAVGCLNAANLFAARLTARSQEFRTRIALGASGADLVRQTSIEALVIAACAGVLGIVVAKVLLAAAVGIGAGTSPGLQHAGIDWRVWSFAFVLALLVGLACALVPAAATRMAAKSDGRTIGGSQRGRRLRAGLVVGQVALSLMLSLGGLMMMRTLAQLLSADLGFDASRVLTFNVQFNTTGTREEGRQGVRAFYADLVDRIGHLPGVEAAAVVNPLPLSGSSRQVSLWIEGRPYRNASDLVRGIDMASVSAGYFDVMNIPIVRGRGFTHETTPPVSGVIVDETFARRFWPDQDPIGKHVASGAPSSGAPLLTVVGLAGAVRQDTPDAPPKPQLYFSHGQWPLAGTIVVRTAGNPEALAPSVRRVVAEADPTVPIWALRPLTDVVGQTTASSKLTTALLTLFSVLALLLTSLGLYGLMAYDLSHRRREIGVRLALGAGVHQVRLGLLGRGLGIVSLGMALGLAGAMATARGLAAVVPGLAAGDVGAYALAICVTLATAFAATVLPVRQAGRVNPAEVLRPS